MEDQVPDIPGIAPLNGISAHHCPYCDGWEHRDQPLAGYKLLDNGEVVTDTKQLTCIPGLYVAGDMSSDAHTIVVAASQGARAAIDINNTLSEFSSFSQ